jgi:hypothetical protein
MPRENCAWSSCRFVLTRWARAGGIPRWWGLELTPPCGIVYLLRASGQGSKRERARCHREGACGYVVQSLLLVAPRPRGISCTRAGFGSEWRPQRRRIAGPARRLYCPSSSAVHVTLQTYSSGPSPCACSRRRSAQYS